MCKALYIQEGYKSGYREKANMLWRNQKTSSLKNGILWVDKNDDKIMEDKVIY